MANDVTFQTSTLASPPNATIVATLELSGSGGHVQVFSLGGNLNSSVASSASDTVVKATKGYLARVLVTTVGTVDFGIYDNASAGSGTQVCFIAANTPAGYIADCQAPCVNGITVKGVSGNPVVTVFYA